MTDTERNELVEKLNAKGDARGNSLLRAFIHDIESLGYEIVKKEHLKEFKDAFVLQQIRNGKFTYHPII